MRLFYEDYQQFRVRVGEATPDLTYDRGLTAMMSPWEGGGLALQLVNGQGLNPAGSTRQFDRNTPKSVGVRFSQQLDFVRLGGYAYAGVERSGGVSNRTTVYGPDATLELGTTGLFDAQFLRRLDDDPFFGSWSASAPCPGGIATPYRATVDAAFAASVNRPVPRGASPTRHREESVYGPLGGRCRPPRGRRLGASAPTRHGGFMTRGLIGGVLGALLLAAAPASAQTNGYLLPCSAAGSLSRGCTTLSAPADASTTLVNPAGLAGIAGRAFEVDGAAFLPTMSYANAVNRATDGQNNVFPLPAVFYAARLGAHWALGAAVQTMGGMGTDYTLANAVLGPDQRYHSKFALMRGGVALAYRPVPRLAVGVMAGALYAQLEMATPYAVNAASLAGMAGLGQFPEYQAMMSGFSEAVAYASITGLSAVGLTAGASVQYEPSPDLALALLWTAPTTLAMGGGTATMDMNAQFNQLYRGMVAANGGNAATVRTQLSGFGLNLASGMTTTFDAEADFGVPQILTLAAGGRLSDRVRAGADVAWIGWAHAFHAMPLTLTNGTSANVNILMNGRPASGGFATGWPLNWKDTWVGRAGVSFRATRALSLDLGGMYGSDPVPDNTLFTVFPAIVEGAATAGLGYQLGAAELHLAYAHTFAHSQTAAPTSLVASEYANSTSTLAENMISLGIGWKF